jgi:UDP-glucose 4-epimerase
MKIFVSGGAGFIGSHMVSKMAERSDVSSIVVYDNFSSGTRKHLEIKKNVEKIRIAEFDIKNFNQLSECMANSSLVIHFAANPDIAKAVNQPDIDFWEGTYLTQNILEAMRTNKIRDILYTSGSGVYGENQNIVFNESYGPLFPISTYGASKLACESLISSYCHMFGLRGRAFRFANVVGPMQTHGVGFDFIRRLSEDSSHLRILGDGRQSKSYIYVDDVINAMLLIYESMLLQDSLSFDVFNVATDDYITVSEIANLACQVLSLDAEKVEFQFTGGDRGWKGDVPKVLFDVKKLKSLGWRASRLSCEAIKDSLCSMKNELK